MEVILYLFIFAAIKKCKWMEVILHLFGYLHIHVDMLKSKQIPHWQFETAAKLQLTSC